MEILRFDELGRATSFEVRCASSDRKVVTLIRPRRSASVTPIEGTAGGPPSRPAGEQIDMDRKCDWIARLGHELRNPVGAISVGLELVKFNASELHRIAPTIEMMQRQIAQMVVLLDDLLDAALITADKLEIRYKPVDVARVALDALDTVGRLLEQRGHEVSVTTPLPGTIWVSGDHVRLVEVVINVLSNAAKYTPRAGRVALEVEAEGETALITVRDTGIGIAADFMPRIFERFSQGEYALDENDRGLGLGLSLARDLVRLHRGEISAFSEGEGRGTEIKIRLPRLRYDIASQLMRSVEAHRTQAVTSRRVLIVEDDADQLETLQQLLSIQGHETRAALSGPAALAVARTFEPDVALIDVGLPEMDGYELAHLLREEFPYALLIAVTGYRKDSVKLGSDEFDHHVIKPIDLSRLSALIAEAEIRAQVGSS